MSPRKKTTSEMKSISKISYLKNENDLDNKEDLKKNTSEKKPSQNEDNLEDKYDIEMKTTPKNEDYTLTK